MATATPNPHAPSGVDRMNTDSYAIYTFANPSATVNSQLESMAMGNHLSKQFLLVEAPLALLRWFFISLLKMMLYLWVDILS